MHRNLLRAFILFLVVPVVFVLIMSATDARSDDQVVDQSGVGHMVVEDPAQRWADGRPKTFLELDATNSGVGLDSRTDHLRVQVRRDVELLIDGPFVPRYRNTYLLPIWSGDVTWEIYDLSAPNYYLAAGRLNLGHPEPGVVSVYSQGYYLVDGGRHWRTDCEPYSQTERCRTEIWASQVVLESGRPVVKTGWMFNNLTYQPSPRSLWAKNPLGYSGEWTALDGRHWRTECDTPTTGRNGCRSYSYNLVVDVDGQVKMAWVFNNIVRFS